MVPEMPRTWFERYSRPDGERHYTVHVGGSGSLSRVGLGLSLGSVWVSLSGRSGSLSLSGRSGSLSRVGLGLSLGSVWVSLSLWIVVVGWSVLSGTFWNVGIGSSVSGCIIRTKFKNQTQSLVTNSVNLL